MYRLEGKVAIITGAGRGIGKAVAELMAREGASIVVNDLGSNLDGSGNSKQPADEVVEYINENGGSAIANSDSVSEFQSSKQIIDCAMDNFGKLDILVNCAGLFFVKSLGQTSAQDFGKCLSINLVSPYLLCKELIPHMITRGWGRVINIASSSAYAGAAKTTAYTASKHGLLGLSRSLNNELKGTGVRVLSVSPGSIQTEMGREVEKLGQDYETFLDPVEVADYIVYNAALNGEMISEEIRLNRINIQ